VRDVEALLEEALGEQAVSKSTVARICQDTRRRYAGWCRRDLSAHDVVYCYLDAIYLKLRPDDEPAEDVLVAWGHFAADDHAQPASSVWRRLIL
jgi:putative transposase